MTDDLTVTNNQRLNAALDWFVTPRLFVRPVVVEYYRDPFQNFAHRWTIGAAVGYQLVDTSRVSWEFNVGPSYQRTIFEASSRESRTRKAPGRSRPAPPTRTSSPAISITRSIIDSWW